MYDLLSKIPDGFTELKRLLETHIYNQGMEAIEKTAEAALNVKALFIFEYRNQMCFCCCNCWSLLSKLSKCFHR